MIVNLREVEPSGDVGRYLLPGGQAIQDAFADLVVCRVIAAGICSIHLALFERRVHVLNHDVLRLDYHAVGIGALGEMVVAEHAEKLGVEEVSLVLVAGAVENRHAKQIIIARAVADRKHRGAWVFDARELGEDELVPVHRRFPVVG